MTTLPSFLAGTVLAAALGGLLVSVPSVAQHRDITGYAIAVDGDTIRLGTQRIRLWGMDAPESRQTCLDASQRPWACGEAATVAMRRMLAEGPVSCERKDVDRYGRTVAVCRVAGRDLGARLVSLGLAVDYTRYSKGAYWDQQEAAKSERMGIWGGTFEMPWDWRKEHKR